MFDIGFGLLLYKILMWIVVPLFVIPFVVNLFNGKGYGRNFKVIWGGFWRFLSFGVRKRNPD
jgi:hypothetical protein